MTFYNLQQLLKKYGTIIYTRDRISDIDMMEDEIKELYQMGLIDAVVYRDARLLLRSERHLEERKRIDK